MARFGNRGVEGSGIAKLAISIPLVLLALAAAVVAIAGIGVVQHKVGDFGLARVSLDFTWFVIAATFFVLFLALIYVLGSSISFIAGAHSAIVGLLAIVTVLCIVETDKWNDERTSSFASSGTINKGAKTAFAGYLSLAVLLSLLIMALGNSASVSRGYGQESDVYQNTKVHSNPVHATGPATAIVDV